MSYYVVGDYQGFPADCESEGTLCNTYAEALKIKAEWEQQKRYNRVFIIRDDWE